MQGSGRLFLKLRSVRMVRAFVLAVLVAAASVATAGSSSQSAPAASTPVTISYEGSFDLTNTMIPKGVQHSYVYHVEWDYSWSGVWGDLFSGGRSYSNQTSFSHSHISGSVHVTWRNTSTGPDVECTLRIVPEMNDFPDFRALYNLGRSTVRIAGLEAPTYRYGRYVGNSDPMCGGGPQIDVFGEPAAWKPLGDGGGTLSLSTGGVHRFDRTWTWVCPFGGGKKRSYVSAMRSALKVSFPR